MSGYYYLATPYTKYPGGTEAAFRHACEIAAKLMDKGIPIFCPIAHTHPIAEFTQADALDSKFWIAADHELMVAARGLIVVKMESWEISSGIAAEINYFRLVGKAIYYMDPNNIESFHV